MGARRTRALARSRELIALPHNAHNAVCALTRCAALLCAPSVDAWCAKYTQDPVRHRPRHHFGRSF